MQLLVFEDLYIGMVNLSITSPKTKIIEFPLWPLPISKFCPLNSEKETLLALSSNINSELPRHIFYCDALV